MIEIFSEEQVDEFIKARKRKFILGPKAFFVLTSKKHILRFFTDKDIGIKEEFTLWKVCTKQPEIAKLYGLEYAEDGSPYIPFSPQILKVLNELYNDPEAFFSYEEDEMYKEFRERGLL